MPASVRVTFFTIRNSCSPLNKWINPPALGMLSVMAVTAKRRTQEERKAESERRILEAAVELFATQGYVKTTLNQVGSRAGYTGGLISSRFGSKENLLKAVLEKIHEGFLQERVAKIADPNDVRGTLHRFSEMYLGDVSKKASAVRALYVVMGEALGAVAEVQQEVADFNEQTRQWLSTTIAGGISTGELSSDLDPDTAAVLILSLIRGVTLQYLADPKRFRTPDIIDAVNGMIDDTLSAPRHE